MKKIVQLDEYEYNKLAELAKLNAEQINQKAADLWEKKGVAEIEINIETGHDTRHVFRIDCRPYIKYRSERFFIPDKLRERFRKIVKSELNNSVEQKFGKAVDMINICNNKIDSVNKTRFLWMLVAASGWAVAAVTLLWYFTK